VVPAGAAGLLPAPDRAAVGRLVARSPATAADHHHLRGQRHGQPGRDHLRLPGPGGDRDGPGHGGSGLHRGPRGVRAARDLAAAAGVGQPGADRRPARRLPWTGRCVG
jgi:hypothetical protein